MEDISFKPEDLHPLAGLGVATMLEVLVKYTDKKLDLFFMFKRTSEILWIINAILSFSAGMTVSTGITEGFTREITILFYVFLVLIVSVAVCKWIIVTLKWKVFDEAKVYNDAAAKIMKDYYGREV